MRIVFLDFDGVLNHRAWIQAFYHKTHGSSIVLGPQLQLNPEAIARLNQILQRTGAKVVISSGWRLLHELDELRTFLADRGFIGEIIDRTPYIDGEPRGLEIDAWIKSCKDPVEYVVLDDATDLDPVRSRAIQTNFDHGLLDEHIEAAVRILQNGEEQEGSRWNP